MVIGLIIVLAAGLGVGVWWLSRSKTDDRYLDALKKAGARDEFPTDQAALVHGRKACERFDETGDPNGGASERAAVQVLCPKWAKDFRFLETVRVEGSFEINDYSEYWRDDDGDPCEGEGGYGDINASTQVIVTNGRGDALTRTSLGQGRVSDLSCRYEFEFEVTEGEETYVVAVGRRGETSYTFEEIKRGIQLSLG